MSVVIDDKMFMFCVCEICGIVFSVMMVVFLFVCFWVSFGV